MDDGEKEFFSKLTTYICHVRPLLLGEINPIDRAGDQVRVEFEEGLVVGPLRKVRDDAAHFQRDVLELGAGVEVVQL